MDAEQPTSQTPTPKSNAKIITTVAVLLVAVLLIVGVKAFAGKSNGMPSNAAANSSATSPATATPSGSSSATTSNSSVAYKDGTYSADGSYVTPESNEKISVTVTLKDGKITETSASADPNNRESKEWQSRFLSGYKQLVVGKSIDDVKLSRVSGSSLTSTGFNNAIDSIKNQAKV